MSSAVADFKDQGNSEYKKGAYLKAAALYTKGLKADPGNAVLLSNRCACLLKLHKLDKALADAQECVRLRGDWDKSHFRLGSALEALGRQTEAVVAFKKAKECNPGSAEVTAKLRSSGGGVQSTRSAASAGGGTATNGSAASGGARLQSAQVTAKVTTAEEYEQAKADMVAGEEREYSEARVLSFAEEVCAAAAEELARAAARERGGGAACGSPDAGAEPSAPEELQPHAYFLPGARGADALEQWGQVRLAAAFDSPDTLQSALGFLRGYAADTRAHAACAVVPRARIAYPQVWKKRGWPLGDAGGSFVQLEARGLRRLWFVQPEAPRKELPEEYKVLEPLFR